MYCLQVLKNLRSTGDRAFAGKDYDGALESYTEALKILPDSHVDKPLFYSNKAACYLQLGR